MVDVQDNVSQNGLENDIHQAKHDGSRRSSTSSGRSKSSKPPAPDPYPKEFLLEPLDKKFICLNCDEILRSPVQIQECGHRLCHHCYEDIRCDGPHTCPEDGMNIDQDTPPTIDKAFMKEVENIQTKCKNHSLGCKWEDAIVKLQEHVKSCEHEDVICEHDCGAVFQRRFKQKHVEKDCGKKIISCTYCDDRFLREDKKNHLLDCPKVPVSCPNKCDKKATFRRDELDKHMEEECNRTKISCDFEDITCDHKASRDKMLKHYTKEITHHVKLLHDTLMQHDALLKQVMLTVETHDDKFTKHEQRIGDLEKIANSQLIWRIDEYSNKMKAAQAGESKTLYSPGFITSKHGYRLSASVCLNGDGKGKGSHLSVFICILKGPYDALLKWPFDCRVNFTLLDQNSDPAQRKHLKFSIKPTPSPENAQFLGRPLKIEKNACFGAAKFAKHSEVESREYIKDDTLFLKISIETDGNSEPNVE